MANAALGFGQLALGAAGLFGASSAQKAQEKYMKAAAASLKLKTQGQKAALGIAEAYDPTAETQKAVDYASSTAADSLGKSLSDVNQRFRNAGGSPTGDTLFRVQAQGATNRVADPLKEFAAQQASQATQMKLAALSSALGAGGDVADSYLNMAGQYQPDYTSAIQAFSAGFGNLTNKPPATINTKKFALQDPRSTAAVNERYA